MLIISTLWNLLPHLLRNNLYPKAHNVSAHTGVVGFYRDLFFVISPRMPHWSLFSLS